MSTRIITVSLNPALDQTVTLDRLTPGTVQRAQSARIDAGGKGVNVASCLADWGVATAITGLLGADNAAAFEHLFAAKNIEDRCVRVPGTTRTNIKLVDESRGETTDVNLPGFTADASVLTVVRRDLRALCADANLVVLSGSLPNGLASDAYVELLEALARHGTRAVLDTSDAALTAALAAPSTALPYAVKPNRHELEAWAGRALPTQADLLIAARELQARGVKLVVISIGEAGALFVHGDDALHALPPAIHTSSTVGAGDAMVAGIAAALLEGANLEATARLATAFATAKLSRAGAHLPAWERVQQLAIATTITRLN